MTGRATIFDVAKAAGVSASTVSRAFSRPGRVSSQTAERIYQVAAELGYRQDEVRTRSLPAETRTIAVSVSDVTNPFYFPIIRGAEEAAAAAGYTLLVSDAQESSVIEREILERSTPLVDGIVVASSRVSDTVLRALPKSVPVVVLNRHVLGLTCLVPDNPRGIRRAVEHLASLGHRHLCYVAGPEASWADGVRWRAFHEAAYELDLTESRVGPVLPTIEGGAAAADEVLATRATGVVAFNDLIAVGLVRRLAALDVRVPDDLSVVGIDNIFAGELLAPTLTTLASPLNRLGAAGVEYLLAQRGDTAAAHPSPIVLPMRLIVRESTGPAPVPRHHRDTPPRRRATPPSPSSIGWP